VDALWATKSEDIGLIVCAISFQDFQPMWSGSTNVTDGQTDGMRSQERALHYSASHGKNTNTNTCNLRQCSALNAFSELQSAKWNNSTVKRISHSDDLSPASGD